LHDKYVRNNGKILKINDSICLKCGHIAGHYCSCKRCWELYEGIMEDFYQIYWCGPSDINELSVFDKVHFLTLIKLFYQKHNGGFRFGVPVKGNPKHFEISQDYFQLVESLIKRKIIIPSKKHNRNMVMLYGTFPNDDDPIKRFSSSAYGEIIWDLNLTDNDKPITIENF